jgi:hypothetical protein
LLSSTDLSLYQVIPEEDETWLISDPGSGMEECIAISTREGLADIGDIGEMRDSFDELEFSGFSLLDESLLELE